jgi:hypothetical protein
LRKQLQPMGLTITSVRGKGYVLHKSRGVTPQTEPTPRSFRGTAGTRTNL